MGPEDVAAAVAVPTVAAVVVLCLCIAYLYFVRRGPVFSVAYRLLGIGRPPKPVVVGYTAPGFESLRRIITLAFEDGHDLGSQFAAYVDGKLVADIATGFTDRSFTTPYTEDTLQLVFSSSKAVTAFVVMHLVNTGRVSLDDPVIKYWPEFGQGGKSHVTVGMLLTHRAGVAFLDPHRVPKPKDLLDLDALANRIASQPHNFDGETVSAYHAVTRGWFLQEVVRRATGKTVREIMYDEIMPVVNSGEQDIELGLKTEDNFNNIDISAESVTAESKAAFQFHYGIPDAPAEVVRKIHATRANLDGYSFVQKLFFVVAPTFILRWFGLYPVPPAFVKAYLAKGTPQNKALMASGPDFSESEVSDNPWCYNDPVLLKSQSPSFSGITNARSLARIAELVRISAHNSTSSPAGPSARGLVNETTYHACLLPLVDDVMEDRVLLKTLRLTRCGLGLHVGGFGVSDGKKVGAETTWIGGSGTGGSMIYFDEKLRITFAFTMNFVQLQSSGDVRSWRLIEELVRIVHEQRGSAAGTDK
ncbi:hypothetical protein HDU82_004061 [Entophlyctis luteolus]|nr:hypothetical protein HDU82_004061 [Entophlyctis luteolus]